MVSFINLQGKKGIWIKLPLGLANLVEPAVSVRDFNKSCLCFVC